VTALCGAASVSSCGRKQTSALSEGAENSPVSTGAKPAELPLEQQTEQKLDPLTKDDVDLYLKIMRASADRVKNRPPADLAALEYAGVDAVWAPAVDEMYAAGFATRVVPDGVAKAGLEDAFRPHFL